MLEAVIDGLGWKNAVLQINPGVGDDVEKGFPVPVFPLRYPNSR